MINSLSFLFQKPPERPEFDYLWLASRLSAQGYRAPVKKIHDLVKAGVLIGVKKGLYVLAPAYASAPICKESLANLIYGPSCISLEYALAHHGLIPERVEIVTSITPKRDKIFQTPLGGFTYRYLSSKKYREGIALVWIDERHPVLMASVEKALTDYLVLNRIRLNSEKEARDFLLDDLRADPQKIKKLNTTDLTRLNRIYESEALSLVLLFLKGAKG